MKSFLKTFFVVKGGILLVLLLVAMAVFTAHDLAHPEIWDDDFTHDPRIGIPVTVIVMVPLLSWWVWEERRLKRAKAELKAWQEVARLLKRPPQGPVGRN